MKLRWRGLASFPAWIAHSISNIGNAKPPTKGFRRSGRWSFLIIYEKVELKMNSDFKELLNIFNEKKVKYLIVGGYAVSEYAEPRFTKDLDIWIEASDKNAGRVFSSLKEFNAPLLDLRPRDFAQEGSFYQMGRPPVRIDINVGRRTFFYGVLAEKSGD